MKRSQLASLVLAVLIVAAAVVLGRPAISLLLAVPVVFGMGLMETDDVVRYLAAQGILDQAGGLKLRIRAKTADYQILSPLLTTGDRSGTIFTNRGAVGAVVFTLPVISPGMAGTFYEFLGIADQTITVASSPADTLLALNDIAADSIAMSTGGAKIGGHCRVVCDGTTWAAYGDAVGITFTVAT